MWLFNGETAKQEEFSYLSELRYDRSFYIEPIYLRDIAGRITRSVSRYEIHESWTSKEQPDMWKCDNRYERFDKDVTVLAFSSREEARAFLTLLLWVLNAPPQIPFTKILSTNLVEILKNANPEELYALAVKEQEELQANLKAGRGGMHVYILQMDNDTVKIGMSVNVQERIPTIISNSGLGVLKWCCTKGFTAEEARAIEASCHKNFSSKRKRGEFFKINYEEAKTHLQTYAPIYYERATLQ